MKKNILILSLVLALALPLGGSIAHAQTTDTPATSAQVDALRDTLIQLLTEMIAQLQAQITELIAQQTATTQAVADVSAKVEQNAPVLGVVAPAPTISVGQARCERGDVILPISVNEKAHIFVRVYGGTVDIKGAGGNSPFDFAFASETDLPVLSDTEVRYEVKATKKPYHLENGLVAPNNPSLAESSGTITLPSCQ